MGKLGTRGVEGDLQCPNLNDFKDIGFSENKK